MAAFPPVDMQIQSADPIGLIRAVFENVLVSLQLTPALQNVGLMSVSVADVGLTLKQLWANFSLE